jgi:hypothetical protein
LGRYDPPDSYPLPRDKRTIKRYGEGADAGKYYECWHCGQTCNKDRDTLGMGTGISILDTVEPVYNVVGQGRNAVTLILAGNHRLWKVLANGDYETIMHNNYPSVSAGCPFCGSKNYA